MLIGPFSLSAWRSLSPARCVCQISESNCLLVSESSKVCFELAQARRGGGGVYSYSAETLALPWWSRSQGTRSHATPRRVTESGAGKVMIMIRTFFQKFDSELEVFLPARRTTSRRRRRRRRRRSLFVFMDTIEGPSGGRTLLHRRRTTPAWRE